MSTCRQSNQSTRAAALLLVGCWVIAWFVATAAPLSAQTSDVSDNLDASIEDPSMPFPMLPHVEHALIKGNMAYVCWPKALVGQATLTAIDLRTLQVKWTYVLGSQDVRILRLFGDQIYCGTGLDVRPVGLSAGYPVGPPPNFYEYLLQADTGQVTLERTITYREMMRWRPPIINDSYLVTDRILQPTGKSRELGFFWLQGAISNQKLYTIGSPDDAKQPLGIAQHPGAGSMAVSVKIDRAPDEEVEDTPPDAPQFEQVLRRTDLATGQTELIVPIPTPAHVGGSNSRFWTLLHAEGDRMVMQAFQLDRNAIKEDLIVCFDLANAKIVWKESSPCEIGRVVVQDNGRLECQCRCQPLTTHETEHGTFARHPLIIDLETGICRPDPAWHDPNSLIYWHIGPDSISHVIRNETVTVAIMNQAIMIGMETTTGRLLWRRDTLGSWPPFTDELYEQIVTPSLGGIEITEVATGKVRRLKPEDVGLETAREVRMPRQFSGNHAPAVRDARTDWFYDRPIVLLPALPLLFWGAYRLYRWRREVHSKTTATL